MQKQQKPLLSRALLLWILGLIIVAIIAIMIGRHHSQTVKQQRLDRRNRAISVVVTTVHRRDMPVYISALGSVTPTYNVTVRTQINGRLLQVYFKEGQKVKTGELMALIDPRPYEAQLTQFEGQLVRDKAALANARIDLQRYKALYPSGAVSKQTYDTQVALVKQDEGTVQFDEGQVQTVKVNLIYCHITSPVTGRVGLRLVDPGNFVQTSDTTGLFVVNTTDPITVVFTIPEDNIPSVVQEINNGKTLRTEAYDRWQNTLLAVGKLLTLDNQIDTTTGTVKLKAIFENPKDALFPDQFVNIRLLVRIMPNMTVVPTAAVQQGAQGSFVFLLDKKSNTVKAQPVTSAITEGNYTAITKGVVPGQEVVIEGGDRLTDGSQVTVTRPAKVAPNKNKTRPSVRPYGGA